MLYKPREGHVVSDLSRFAFDPVIPRHRSRNTSPILHDLTDTSPDRPMQHVYPVPDYERLLPSTPRTDSDRPLPPPKDYRGQTKQLSRQVPRGQPAQPTAAVQPFDVSGGRREYVPPQPPYPVEPEPRSKRNYLSYFASLMEPPERKVHYKDEQTGGEVESLHLNQKQLEADLLQHVMNSEILQVRAKYFFIKSNSVYGFGASSLIYLFEILCGIASISLLSVLLGNDKDFPRGIYRFMIADSVISTVVAFLFITAVVDLQRRSGSFYCAAAAIIKLVLFILVVSKVVPTPCSGNSICKVRKAVTAFTIILTFLWETHLVMFLTTSYISQLDLLLELKYDYSNAGIEAKKKRTGFGLEEYVFDHEETLFIRVEPGTNVRGKRKIIVYIDVEE